MQVFLLQWPKVFADLMLQISGVRCSKAQSQYLTALNLQRLVDSFPCTPRAPKVLIGLFFKCCKVSKKQIGIKFIDTPSNNSLTGLSDNVHLIIPRTSAFYDRSVVIANTFLDIDRILRFRVKLTDCRPE